MHGRSSLSELSVADIWREVVDERMRLRGGVGARKLIAAYLRLRQPADVSGPEKVPVVGGRRSA